METAWHLARAMRCVILVLAWSACPAFGATLHPPSESIFPGEQVQARVNAAPAGTTFTLKSGLHRMQSIVPRSGETFAGEAGSVLSGARIFRPSHDA